jgi:hypothetical protein
MMEVARMSRINGGRVLAGGLLAGILINAVDYAVNAVWLAGAWDDGLRGLGMDPAQVSPLGWILSDLIFGLFVVWLYAGIRPRFGPGPMTALLAAVAVWAISHIAYGAFMFIGLFPGDLVMKSAAGALVAFVLGGLAGGAVYKEA